MRRQDKYISHCIELFKNKDTADIFRKGVFKMSLCSTYVQSQEGNWYKNPIIWGEDASYFVCWDDDDPIELVIRIDSNMTLKKVVDELYSQGWNIELLGHKMKTGDRYFGDKFYPARAYWLRQNDGPTETQLLTDTDATLMGKIQPKVEGTFYTNRINGY
ncbi:MAG: hypothetical protein JKY33_10525 [Bacteroidia bacterium]|nr:hypothetical protein [Bacteroidia bacterium]